MVVTSLRVILNKTLNPVFRRGYIKYLKSLDFEEFNFLFLHYSRIISTVLYRVTILNPKLFSKNWVKKKILTFKYNQLFAIFSLANRNYIDRITKKLEDDNKKIFNLLNDIARVQRTIQSLYGKPQILTPYSSDIDLINFYIYLVCNVYNAKELERLVNELNELKKKPQ